MFLKKERCSKTNVILVILVLLLTMCGTGSAYAFPVVNLNAVKIGVSLLIILLTLLIVNKKINHIKYDTIASVLFFRVIYYTIIVALHKDTNYLSLYLATVLGFVAYIVAININISQKQVLKISEMIVIISGIQTALTVIESLSMGIPMYMIKSQIVTPIGASNMLAVIWVFMFPLIYKLEQSKIKKNFFFIFIFVLILLSKSNTGTVMFIIESIMLLLSEKKYKLTRIIFVSVITYLIMLFISNNTIGYFDRISKSLKNIFSGSSNRIEQTLNGRAELYKTAITLIKARPIFGYSFSYRYFMPDNMMAHNWIFESLLSGGIVGFILQVISYFFVFFKIINDSKRTVFEEVLIMSIIITLIQGLFEPSLGGMVFDLLFWLFIGAGISQMQKNIEKETNY